MIINKSSWHYWLVEKFNGSYRMPGTLCSYFWTLVMCIFVSSLLVVGASFFTAGVPIFAWSAFHNHSSNSLKCFEIAVAVPTSLVLVYLLIGAWEKYERNNWDKDPKTKEPNILIEMIKAAKKKYCPFITYKDVS